MRIIHIYDGHERVFPGEGSVSSIVCLLIYPKSKLRQDESQEIDLKKDLKKTLIYNEKIY